MEKIAEFRKIIKNKGICRCLIDMYRNIKTNLLELVEVLILLG